MVLLNAPGICFLCAHAITKVMQSEDDLRDMQTRDARCGEHGESRMVHPLRTNRMPPLEGPMQRRDDLR
jgi:hypothetical protein